MNNKILLLLISVLLITAPVASAQGKWELKKQEDGMEVYTRSLENEKFKEIRVVTVLPASTEELVGVLFDVDSHKGWVYGLKKSHLIKRTGKNALVYYNEADLPWPFSDRDMVARMTVTNKPKTKQTILQTKSDAAYLPPKSGLVRIPYSLATWRITPVAENQVKVDYTFSIDPGGALPAWLVNSIATTGPLHSFKKLMEILQKKS